MKILFQVDFVCCGSLWTNRAVQQDKNDQNGHSSDIYMI